MATALATSQADQAILALRNGQPQPVFSPPLTSSSITQVTNDNLDVATNSQYISQNPNYRVSLTQNASSTNADKGQLTVVGNTPADFEFSLTNNYTTLLDFASQFGFTGGNAVGGLVGAGLNLAIGGLLASGSAATVGSLQVWTGTQPLEFTLPLSFRAFSNPAVDVIQPIVNIIKMASPVKSLGGAFLSAPGPSLLDMTGTGIASVFNSVSAFSDAFTNLNKNNKMLATKANLQDIPNAITMRFGRSIIVPGLVITGLTVKMANRAERKTGLPIACEANLSMRTCMDYGQQDVLQMFFGTNDTVRALTGLTTSGVSGVVGQ